MISTLLFIMPFVSGIVLLISGKWFLVIRGILIIFLTIQIWGLSLYIEKFMAKKFSLKKLSYLLPIYYFTLTIVSVSACWFFINSGYKSDIWVFLFAFSSCYVPYHNMVQGEKATEGFIRVLTIQSAIIQHFSTLYLEYWLILLNFLYFGGTLSQLLYVHLFLCTDYQIEYCRMKKWVNN